MAFSSSHSTLVRSTTASTSTSLSVVRVAGPECIPAVNCRIFSHCLARSVIRSMRACKPSPISRMKSGGGSAATVVDGHLPTFGLTQPPRRTVANRTQRKAQRMVVPFWSHRRSPGRGVGASAPIISQALVRLAQHTPLLAEAGACQGPRILHWGSFARSCRIPSGVMRVPRTSSERNAVSLHKSGTAASVMFRQ